MAKAAAHLSISHPVVSKTITDLERTLGVRLFDRNVQGVELTAYGRALLKCGVTVFDEMRQGLKQIELLADPASGDLRIGSAEITMAGFLPPIVERFSAQYPRVRLHVTLANTAMLQFGSLRERSVDLLIGRMPQTLVEDDLEAEILFDEPTASGRGAGRSDCLIFWASPGCCRLTTAPRVGRFVRSSPSPGFKRRKRASRLCRSSSPSR